MFMVPPLASNEPLASYTPLPLMFKVAPDATSEAPATVTVLAKTSNSPPLTVNAPSTSKFEPASTS